MLRYNFASAAKQKLKKKKKNKVTLSVKDQGFIECRVFKVCVSAPVGT